jgi:CubicO group peptidase (beta-lactamase class C family)
LKDTLRKFFPELPYPEITIKHLLTHTSGLPDDMAVIEASWNHTIMATNNDLIKMLAKNKFSANFQPGEKWEYLNTAFELLGSIICSWS